MRLFGLDSHSRWTRLAPVLFVSFPVGLVIISWYPFEPEKWGVFLSVATAAGVAVFLTQLGHDQGETKEKELIRRWGDRPTTTCLSHHSSPLNALTIKRYHAKLRRLRRDLKIPSAEEETGNPQGARQIYESATDFLLERTRDERSFPLLAAERLNYGFRRNLWAMKPAGLSIAAISAILCFIRVAYQWEEPDAVAMLSAFVCLVLVILWAIRITPSWVRIAANAFARRLVATLDVL